MANIQMNAINFYQNLSYLIQNKQHPNHGVGKLNPHRFTYPQYEGLRTTPSGHPRPHNYKVKVYLPKAYKFTDKHNYPMYVPADSHDMREFNEGHTITFWADSLINAHRGIKFYAGLHNEFLQRNKATDCFVESLTIFISAHGQK